MNRTDLKKLFIEYTNSTETPFIKKHKKSVRLLSFNVQMWKTCQDKESIDKVIELIADSDADIIGLYETLFNSQPKKANIIEKFKSIGFKHVLFCNYAHGINMLASKFPITSHKSFKLVKDPIRNMARHALCASINVNDQQLKVVLTHLDCFDETEDTRCTQMKEILKEIDDEYIIMGDFNALRKDDYDSDEWKTIIKNDKLRNVDTQHKLIKMIEKNKFVDSFVKSDTDCPKVSVWSNRRVDYIYIGDKFKYDVLSSNIYPTLVSDHYPVYIDVSI